jgi:hypothetical protein
METQILQLEKRLADLKMWKASVVREQLKYPLDTLSQKALDEDPFVLIWTGHKRINFNNLLETGSTTFGLTVYINNERRVILCNVPLKEFTASFGSNTFTNVDGAHNLKNGDRVVLTTDTALPTGLSTNTSYYIINATGTTFKLSTSIGGSEVNITNNGVGLHSWTK